MGVADCNCGKCKKTSVKRDNFQKDTQAVEYLTDQETGTADVVNNIQLLFPAVITQL